MSDYYGSGQSGDGGAYFDAGLPGNGLYFDGGDTVSSDYFNNAGDLPQSGATYTAPVGGSGDAYYHAPGTSDYPKEGVVLTGQTPAPAMDGGDISDMKYRSVNTMGLTLQELPGGPDHLGDQNLGRNVIG